MSTSVTVSEFLRLMTKHKVPADTVPVREANFLFSVGVADKLFYGRDTYGRVFINVPISFRFSPEFMTKCAAGHQPTSGNGGFIVFQSTMDRDGEFMTSGYLAQYCAITRKHFFGNQYNDLSWLGILLTGHRLHLEVGAWSPVDQNHYDPERWVDITLRK